MRASPALGQLHAHAPSPAGHVDPFPEYEVGEQLPEGYGEPPPAPPKNRRSGIILHPTSLPGPYGCGEIGDQALLFVDWLAASGQQIWQARLPSGCCFWFGGFAGMVFYHPCTDVCTDVCADVCADVCVDVCTPLSPLPQEPPTPYPTPPILAAAAPVPAGD